jgi:putative SOS response-associated peptidase YedK
VVTGFFAYHAVPTNVDALAVELHNRMPAVLKPEAWSVWLGEQPADVPQLKALLAPYPSEEMTSWPVSARVGNVKNNDASLIDPLAGVA